MSEYANKTNGQIIDEQAASLNAKSDNRDRTAQFDPRRTDLGDTTGVNESGLSEFPGASVETGRNGQTGGGANSMNIRPEHGGDPRNGGSASSDFEGVPAGEDRQSWAAKTNPGSINVSGGRTEALRTTDAPRDGEPQLGEQVRQL